MNYKDNYNKALYIIQCYSDRYEDANPTEEDWKQIIETHTLDELKKVMEDNDGRESSIQNRESIEDESTRAS